MKGVVFTELLTLIEEAHGPHALDEVIREAGLPNDGAYTAVGTYDHAELFRLVAALARRSGRPSGELLRRFGAVLFARFAELHPRFFVGISDAFAFLRSVERVVHAEVLKLYPDAQLPRFGFTQPLPEVLVLEYRSPRGLGDLAEGLVLGCIGHYGGGIALQRDELAPQGGEQVVRFTLRQAAR